MLIILSVVIFTCQLVLSDQLANNRPIIAVLSQEYFDLPSTSYIAASYVKHLESSGARIVPIFLKQDINYYKNIINSTNGLLFPGGGQCLDNSLYADFGKIVWNLAIEKQKTEYYPIWGTCLGFELISQLAVGKNWLKRCNSKNVAMNLNFPKEIVENKTRLFRNADSRIINILKTKNVTFNYHQWCLTPENFTRSNLTESYVILTTNQDNKNSNLEFISTFEHKTLPIYGVQWHPEKNQYEFRINKNYNKIPHDENAVLIGQYFANFFVNETRKSYSQFKNASEESKYLIYNYNTIYTGAKKNQSYEQIYVFPFPS